MPFQRLHADASTVRNTVVAPSPRDLRAASPRKRDMKFGRREVSVARREVLVDGVSRPLQPRPFDVLVYLIENRDRVVTTDELLDNIWKDEIVQPGSLTAAIMRIRKALLEAGKDSGAIIRTHQGVGYRFVAELDDPQADATSPQFG